MLARIWKVIWGTPARKIVTILVAVFVMPAWVFNYEKWLQTNGYDSFLADHNSAFWRVIGWISSVVTSSGFRWAIVGAALALIADGAYRYRRQGAPDVQTPALEPADPARREQLNALIEHINKLYQSFGMAIGREDRLSSDLAITGCEAFLLEMSRRNDIVIPDLRTGGSQAAVLRVLAFFNEVVPALQLDDDEEARRRAADIVPKLNAKSEDELRADMDIPRIFPREQAKPIPIPPPAPPPAPIEARRKGPFYEYPKAVLQVEAARVTNTAAPNGEIRRVSGYLVVKNDSYTTLNECKAMLMSLTVDGVSEPVVEPFDTGATILGSGLGNFEVQNGHNIQIGIITRDLQDAVSKPPFMLNLAGIRKPLRDSTDYQLRVELRSEYEHPTVVDLLLSTGLGSKLKITLQDQFVGRLR
jgi:hypothetical protein